MAIRLATWERPQTVWAVYGMRRKDVVRAFRIVEQHHDLLLEAWERIHGTPSDE